MTQNPYYSFKKSPEQLRLQGACGGRTFGRNQRLRRRTRLAMPEEALPSRAATLVTAAESIAVLDARFPWLHGAEKRRS